MESLSLYLRGTVSSELHDLYMAVLAYFDQFGVDMHVVQIDSLLATADDRDVGEVLAFLESIITDQTNAILLAHRIDAYPTSINTAHDYLRALAYYQDLGGDAWVLGMLEDGDNAEDIFGELVGYACNTPPETYLSEIRRVDPEALAAIEAALVSNDATEDEDYDDEDSDDPRLSAVGWVRDRLRSYRDRHPQPSTILTAVTEEGMKLALPVAVVWAALQDRILDLPEDQWVHELLSLALASRMAEEEVSAWVSEQLTQYSSDPLTVKSAQQVLHQRLRTPTT